MGTLLTTRRTGTFGVPEPLFGRDPAFYVFSLPWLKFVQGWLFSALVGITLLVATSNYDAEREAIDGTLRPCSKAFRV